MKKLDKRLLGLIKHTRGQFIAIVAVVAVGLMIYMSMASAAVNLQTTLNDYYALTNFSDIFVQVVKIPEKDISRLESQYNFLDAEGRIVFDIPMVTDNEDDRVTVRVVSITDDNEINSLYFIKGNPIRDSDHDVIIIEQFADARNIKVNDEINMQISGRQYKMNVSGIAASPEYIYMIEDEQNMLPNEEKFGVVFVSKSFAQRSFGFPGSFNEIVIRTYEHQNADQIKNNLEDDLERYGLKRIVKKENQLSNRMITEELIQLNNSSSSIPILFLSIAGIVLVMMISRMVKKDRISIGVLKALGYHDFQIIIHYAKYAMYAGFIGVFAGSVLGAFIAGGMTKLYIDFFNIPLLKVNFYMKYVIWSFVFTGVFCGLAGMWGAKGILKINPAESMRPEAPRVGKRIFLERIHFIWRRLSFSWKMIIKNAFRNKKRMVFVLSGVALTCSLMVATLGLVESTFSIFDKHFNEFQKMDYNVNFNTPLNKSVVKEVPHIVKVQNAEPKIEFPFELTNGLKKQVVNMIGLEKNTGFYKFENTKGEPIKVPEEGILITENLSKQLKVKKGETIRIHSFIPDKKDVDLVVVDIIRQGLGMNAYMELNGMAKVLLEDQLITGFYANSNDDGFVKKLMKADYISNIQSTEDMLNVFQEFMGLTIMSIGVIVVMAGILGFSIVYNATIISLSEREMEFSSMRVLGFSKKEIFTIILRENIIITIFGMLIGIPLGNFLGSAMGELYSNEIYTLQIVSTPKVYLAACFFTIIFIMFSQIATYKKINKLNFLQALKNRVS